jgi:hypothetical protein
VIVAEEVEDAVDYQQAELGLDRVVLLLGLAVRVGEGDNYFAEGFAGVGGEHERFPPAFPSAPLRVNPWLRQRRAFAVKCGGGSAIGEGEGEDICRLVEAAVVPV